MTVSDERTDDIEYWLAELTSAGYDFVYYPNREDIEVMGAVRRWRDCGLADVVLIRSEDDGVAYRNRCGECENPFAPGIVVGQMMGNALNAVRVAVQLPRPGVAGAPDIPEAMNPMIADMAAPLVRGFYTTRYNNTRHRTIALGPLEENASIDEAAS